MLVAYGPHDRPIIAQETPLEQLQQWSHQRTLHCPNCRSIVHLRGGPGKRAQLHFAHQKSECPWRTEPESPRHMRGKIVLAHWLRQQFPQAIVTLEERLPEPNRIADIFVVHPHGQRWAIEFQCAPLDLQEWQHRHSAYRNANIIDTWIIGDNRRQKQEAFIQAIIAAAHEIMFLDPLITPPRIWLHCDTLREWQQSPLQTPSLSHLGHGASLTGQLHEVSLGEQSKLIHPTLLALEQRIKLLRIMSVAPSIDEATLAAYLHHSIDDQAIRVVIRPLARAYLRDPDLLQRYNYGRGRSGVPPSAADKQRLQQAHTWLASLAQQKFTPDRLQSLAKEIPFVGPYASFAGYIEMLIATV